MKKIAIMSILFLGISSAALAQDTAVVEEVLVKINDEIITRTEFNQRFDPVKTEIERRFEGEELQGELFNFKKDLFNVMINRRLMKQRAQKLGVRMPESYYEQVLNFFKEQSKSETDEEFLRALADNGMTLGDIREMAEREYTERALFQFEVLKDRFKSESEYQEYYEEHADRYSTPTSYKLGQIVIPFGLDNKEAKRTEAEELVSRLRAGEDFGEVYREVTPQAAPDAEGDIGNLTEDSLREDMRNAIADLEEGGISDLIETPAAFLVIKVKEKQESRLIPLEEIKDQVIRDMQMEAVAEGLDELIIRYKNEAYIEVKSEEFMALYDPEATIRGR